MLKLRSNCAYKVILIFGLTFGALWFDCCLANVLPPIKMFDKHCEMLLSDNEPSPASCRSIIDRYGGIDEAIEACKVTVQSEPSTVLPYLELASLYSAKERYDKAVDVCRDAEARFSESSVLFWFMARYLLKGGHINSVVEMCEARLAVNPADTRVRYRLGCALYQMKRYDDAIQEQQRVLQINPRNCDAYNAIALSLFKKGDNDSSVEWFEAGLAVHTNCAVLFLNMGIVLADSGRHEEGLNALVKSRQIYPGSVALCDAFVNEYLHNGDTEMAKQVCFDCIELAPWSFKPYLNLSIICFNTGEPRQRCKYTKIAAEKNPVSYSALYHLGYSLFLLKKSEEAVSPLKKAIALESCSVGAYTVLAQSLRFQMRFDEAVEVCKEAITKFPKEVQPWIVLGEIYSNQGKYEQALERYDSAIALSNDCVKAIELKAGVLSLTGKMRQAADSYRRVVQISPSNMACRFNLYKIEKDKGDMAAAQRVIDQALVLSPTNSMMLVAHSQVMKARGDLTGALSFLEHAVQEQPNASVCRFELANTYYKRDRMVDAISNLVYITENDTTFIMANRKLGLFYAESGRLRQALVQFKRCLDNAPSDPGAHIDVGYTYYNLRLYKEAIQEYEKAIKCDSHNALAHYNMALVCYRTKQFTLGLKYYNRSDDLGYEVVPKLGQLLRQGASTRNRLCPGTIRTRF